MSDAYWSDFASALESGEVGKLTPWLAETHDLRHFQVYRNTVIRSAIEALRAAYPAVNRLVGDNFFSPMARAYWEQYPPARRSMTQYGEHFAEHVASWEAARDLPYLPAVAEWDRAWLEAHHATNADPLGADHVAALDPASLPGLTPGLHPSVRLLRQDWPGHEIWANNRFKETPDALDVRPGDHAGVVWRPGGEVRHAALSRPAWSFLTALGEGLSLEHAAADAQAVDPDFDVARYFGAALTDGLLGGDSHDS